MNTKIDFCYGSKGWFTVIICGAMTEEQKERILDCICINFFIIPELIMNINEEPSAHSAISSPDEFIQAIEKAMKPECIDDSFDFDAWLNEHAELDEASK